METGDLIRALQADAGRRRALSLDGIWLLALAVAAAAAAISFFVLLSPREDLSTAIGSVRFLAKFVYAGLLLATAWIAVRILSRPEGSLRQVLPLLAAAPVLLLAAAVLELAVLPQADWGARWIGRNARWCMLCIPLIGLAPLGLLLLALREGAPSRSGQAGAVAGLVAGGLGALFYAVHCPDDSPLFVATWYTIAVAVMALIGALGGRIIARW
ncbi:MAG: DUF1109 family protein [Rhizobiaceae bacterium]|nr:DUF1109 family protein [Rhizobiaceae bacterium]